MKPTIKYSFFVAGHAYGNVDNLIPGLHPPFVEDFENINADEKIKLGFFTGDFIHFHDKIEYWEKAMDEIAQLNCESHFIAGNHENYKSNYFQKFIGKSYYAFEKFGDQFIILNANENGWNIEGNQLEFLKNTIQAGLSTTNHIFIFTHQLIWWQDSTAFGTCMPNSLAGKADILNFHQEILPFLFSAKKPVYLFAGDVGAIDGQCSFYQQQVENVTLLASGMGNNKTDNYLKVDVWESKQVEVNKIELK